jgi:hypothetical protein
MDQPKRLTGSSQKVKQSVDLITATGHTDIQTAGVNAGAKSFLSLNQNMGTQLASRVIGKAPRKCRRQVCWERRLEEAKAVL